MAVTTLMLIFVRNMLRALDKLPPSGNFEPELKEDWEPGFFCCSPC